MLTESGILTFVLFAWLFLKWMQEGELRDELVARGVTERAADRAVRYGRAAGIEEPPR